MTTKTQNRAKEQRRAAQLRGAGLSPKRVEAWVRDAVGEDLHAKQVLSLSNGVTGVLYV